MLPVVVAILIFLAIFFISLLIFSLLVWGWADINTTVNKPLDYSMAVFGTLMGIGFVGFIISFGIARSGH